ncbi:uncharacterized protein [Oscarella lobularis]|uniref:uncharacterized protein n=1 Tax=Oscarella lobularis TaxID=121494 RepID=UPI0033136217
MSSRASGSHEPSPRDWRVVSRASHGESGCHLEIIPPLTSSSPSHHATLGESWRMRAVATSAARKISDKSNVRKFYARQSRIMRSFEEAEVLSANQNDDVAIEEINNAEDPKEEETIDDRNLHFATNLSLFLNVLLFIGKLLASILSGSLSVISSLVDSALDLFSGITLWLVSRAMQRKKLDVYRYPTGKRRLEPVAIIVCASVMGTATLQLVSESLQSIFTNGANPDVGVTSGTFMGCTVIVKFLLYLYCRRVRSPTAQALALDHRNDVASNIAAILFGLLGTFMYKNADPLGAILIAAYILINWCSTGYEQAKMLIGHTASSDFLKKLTYLASNHHEDVVFVDTVRAYHFGNRFLVEVHIVLDPETPLRLAHDVGESLQWKLEHLEEVDRAFVHLDFDVEHDPAYEHFYKD